jgi:hypothetical protein
MDDTSGIFWLNYLFFTDFTSDAASIVDLPEGLVNTDTATLLAALLSTHDTGVGRPLWTDKAGAEWSTAGATIVYNGPNSTGQPSNALFANILILEFPATSTAPVGRIVLNYNDPVASTN